MAVDVEEIMDLVREHGRARYDEACAGHRDRVARAEAEAAAAAAYVEIEERLEAIARALAAVSRGGGP